MITDLAIVERIAVGAALGGVIGYERDRHGRPAGLRTHTVVALAAATFMVISAHFAQWQTYAANDRADAAAFVTKAFTFLWKRPPTGAELTLWTAMLQAGTPSTTFTTAGVHSDGWLGAIFSAC